MESLLRNSFNGLFPSLCSESNGFLFPGIVLIDLVGAQCNEMGTHRFIWNTSTRSEEGDEVIASPNYLLRNARLAMGINRRKFARTIGVDPTTLYRWEMGLQDPFPIHKRKLTEFFGKSLQELGLTLESGPSSEHGDGDGGRFRSSQPVVLAETELVGRECDLAAVRERLFAGRAALVGLPGVGKTTLVLELASDPQVRAAFPHGIFWADVGQNASLDGVLRSWCKFFLGFSPQKMARLTREKLIIALQTAISDQKICFILDDVWYDSDARILLQVGGPNCGVIVTTRSPIVAAELTGNEFYVLGELDATAGLHLLSLLAPQAVELEPEKAQELVQAVGGLPLALILMGHYLAGESGTGQARRITRALDRLSDANERLNTGTEEHSLRSVISLSENLLSETERAAFHTLSLLPPKPGRFSEQAALSVGGCTIEVLDALVDLGLLEPTGTSEECRMHQTISDYCRSLLSPAEQRLAEERLLASILGEIDARAGETAWLEQEKQTILLAIDAAEHLERPKELIHLTLMMAPFLVYYGLLTVAQVYLQRACAIARQQQAAPELPRLLLYLGEALMLLAIIEEGLAAHQEGLTLARNLRDDACTCEILGTLAWHAHIYGEYTQADSYLQEGLELATRLDLPNVLFVLYRVQGSQAWASGDYVQAEVAYQRGLSLVERLDDRARVDLCMYYCFLGVFEGERGRYPQAETYFQQAIVASQLYGFRDFVPFTIARRAMMRLMVNPSDELRKELEEAIHSAQVVGSWGYVVYTYKALAQLELLRGNVDQAEEVARQSLAIVEPFQAQNRLGEHRTILAQIELARGNYSESAAYFDQCLPPLRIYGAAEDQAIAFASKGELELARGDLNAAAAAFRDLFEIGPTDFLAPLALGYFGRARLAAARRDWGEARKLGEKSRHMLETLQHIRTPEVRAWVESLHKPFWQTFRNRRKSKEP